MVSGMVRDVLEQPPQGRAERLALGVSVVDDAVEVG